MKHHVPLSSAIVPFPLLPGPGLRAARAAILGLMAVSLGACAGGVGGPFGAREAAQPEPQVVAVAPDVPSTEQGRFLGFTVASLGDATVPGLWIETPLTSTEVPGRVVAESGLQLVLTLRPSGGARNSGSRLSLQAYQELGIAPTALPTLTVLADG